MIWGSQMANSTHDGGMSARHGILLVVSGPSGSGKTTICRRLADAGEVAYSISCTTRQPRPGEQQGRDYHFLTREEFEVRVLAGDFLEHAEVHGHFYGSLKTEVISHLQAGRDVVMDIDIQGAQQIRACGQEEIRCSLVDLFVMPPSEAELYARLSGRGTDSKETIALRMQNALAEMAHSKEYAYLLLSSTQEDDYARAYGLLRAERMRTARMV